MKIIYLLTFSLYFTFALANEKADKAKELSSTILSKAKTAMSMDQFDRETLLDELRTRKEMLKVLVRQDSSLVFQLALPEETKEKLPEQAKDLLEVRSEIQGKLEVLVEDYPDGSHRQKNFIKEENGKRFELHLGQGQLRIPNDAKVKAKGLLIDEELAVESAEEVLMLAADGDATGGSNGGTVLAANYAMGPQAVYVINFNFIDNPAEPWSVEQARDVVFGTVNDFIVENSSGQTSMYGDVSPWITIPMSGLNGCKDGEFLSAAIAEADRLGLPYKNYHRLIFAMPRVNGCGYSGVAGVGGHNTSMLINGSMQWYTVAHEFGHNLGLYHSHALDCGSEIATGTCSKDEYGDKTDIMGSGLAHFNPFQKERLGWLTDAHIQSVTQSGTYTIESYASTLGTRPKALKFFKGFDPSSGKKQWYYVEFRKAINFDGGLAQRESFQNGVAIHTGIIDSPNSSFLLDMTPGSYASNYADSSDSGLLLGETYEDLEGQLSVTTLDIGEEQAQVEINLINDGTDNSCRPATPELKVSPSTISPKVAGDKYTYLIYMYNNDGGDCAPRTFNMSAILPEGWQYAFSSSTFEVQPTTYKFATIQVTSPLTAIDGFYDITVASNSDGFSDAKTVQFVVENPLVVNNVPVAANDLVSTAFEAAVTIDVLKNDSDADGDILTVLSLANVTNGSASINSDNTITFFPASGFSGQTVFSYVITDSKENATGQVTVNVAAPPANATPVALNDSAATEFEVPVTIDVLANDYDPDGDQLTLLTIDNIQNGTTNINSDNTVTFFPSAGFSGSAGFSYTITDSMDVISAQVTIDIAPVTPANQVPLAQNDSASTDFETSVVINILANDTDPDGDILSLVGVSLPLHGTVIISNGSIAYTPDLAFSGSDSFSYTISDDKGATATATVSINVNPAPPQDPNQEVDLLKPIITITSPQTGSTVVSKEILIVDVDTQDENGITKVEFYVNQVLMFTDTEAPFSFQYRIPSNKTSQYEITATAYDPSTNYESDSIIVSKATSSGGKGRNR